MVDAIRERVIEEHQIAPQAIVRVANDPSRMELGSIAFEFQGGAQ